MVADCPSCGSKVVSPVKSWPVFSRSNTNLMQRRNSARVLLNARNAERNSDLVLSVHRLLRDWKVSWFDRESQRHLRWFESVSEHYAGKNKCIGDREIKFDDRNVGVEEKGGIACQCAGN